MLLRHIKQALDLLTQNATCPRAFAVVSHGFVEYSKHLLAVLAAVSWGYK
jgi:hypothetical protein